MTPTTQNIADLSKDAMTRISTRTVYTPLIAMDIENGKKLHLKLENRQHTGSFKARGSLNKILKLAESGKEEPVITASTGNHALGVARALKITGRRGTIVLPQNAAPYKLEKLAEYPVDLLKIDGSSLDAELFAKQRAAETESIWVSPYNDVDILSGQGTIALEVLDQCPDVDVVFVTVGGGGLVSGIGSVLKEANPNIHIVGCQPENSPEMKLSVEAGRIVDFPNTPTLSDGSAGGIEPGAITFPLCQEVIDQFCLISEDEIENAIRLVFQRTGEKIEGAAGVAVAAASKILPESNFIQPVAVICGGNIESDLFESIVRE
jgi:threonine dehydratase